MEWLSQDNKIAVNEQTFKLIYVYIYSFIIVFPYLGLKTAKLFCLQE